MVLVNPIGAGKTERHELFGAWEDDVPVYVDDMQATFGRMKMSHMVADSTAELVAMADAIGVQRKWIQKAGTAHEHFDICLSKKAKAVQLGAQEITQYDLAVILKAKREGSDIAAALAAARSE